MFEGFYLVLVWLQQTPPQVPTPNTAGHVETRVFREKLSASPQTCSVCVGAAGKKLYTPCCTPAEWRLALPQLAQGTRWWRWVLTAAATLGPKSREVRRAPPTLTRSLQLEGFSPGSQSYSSLLPPEHQRETTHAEKNFSQSLHDYIIYKIIYSWFRSKKEFVLIIPD